MNHYSMPRKPAAPKPKAPAALPALLADDAPADPDIARAEEIAVDVAESVLAEAREAGAALVAELREATDFGVTADVVAGLRPPLLIHHPDGTVEAPPLPPIEERRAEAKAASDAYNARPHLPENLPLQERQFPAPAVAEYDTAEIEPEPEQQQSFLDRAALFIGGGAALGALTGAVLLFIV